MNFERQKLIVERLRERTLAGELPWQEGVRPESFQVSFPGSSVQISSTGDARFNEYRLSIVDATGRVTDSFDNIQLDRDGLHPSGSWALIMRDLFAAARRSALRADEALDNILAAIG